MFLIGSIFAHAIYMDAKDWRSQAQRYHCIYNIGVSGLSGNEVSGTTVIMVPIPASKEGKFFNPPIQKDPYFTQDLMHEILNQPEQYRKGPYFENATEAFDNKERGNWTTFIAETDKGYMYGFRTNETKLEDISFDREFVADYFDIFDPINNGSPILYPIESVSNNSSILYKDYTKYSSNPTYDSYVYISDNLKGAENIISFNIQLDANNDPSEWPREYRGCYKNLLLAKVNGTGYVKVKAILGQEIPWGNNSNWLWDSQYVLDFYGNLEEERAA
ncbi:hypothetical protein FQU78_11805 [Methanosarcina mazei]|uniref:Uncharacterized protein n=4 Tax=Methanosarcina mazei TaxID=2209 RepID=A0A6C0VJK8_METMZ|nr:hypothetical protein FQU78_11805 [Methanosarcina mazei]